MEYIYDNPSFKALMQAAINLQERLQNWGLIMIDHNITIKRVNEKKVKILTQRNNNCPQNEKHYHNSSIPQTTLKLQRQSKIPRNGKRQKIEEKHQLWGSNGSN